MLFVCSVAWLFLLGCQYCTSASDWLERLVSEMTYNVLMGMLNPTHSPFWGSFLFMRTLFVAELPNFENLHMCSRRKTSLIPKMLFFLIYDET